MLLTRYSSGVRSSMTLAFAFVFLGCMKGSEGEKCDDKSDCIGALACVGGVCSIDATLNRTMASQSGVVLAGEKPASPSNALGAVRVRSASGESLAFAICAADERLTGGWCDPMSHGSGDNMYVTSQGVSGHTKTDTIGARWKCELRDETVRAHALCQKILTPSPPPEQSPTKPTSTE